MKEAIATASAPAAQGPYSQGVKTDSLVFVSGQLGLDHATGDLVSDELVPQVEKVIDNIEAVLAAEGLTLADVVK